MEKHDLLITKKSRYLQQRLKTSLWHVWYFWILYFDMLQPIPWWTSNYWLWNEYMVFYLKNSYFNLCSYATIAKYHLNLTLCSVHKRNATKIWNCRLFQRLHANQDPIFNKPRGKSGEIQWMCPGQVNKRSHTQQEEGPPGRALQGLNPWSLHTSLSICSDTVVNCCVGWQSLEYWHDNFSPCSSLAEMISL